MAVETFSDQIKVDHSIAELERLDAGMDGCGCQDCQDFYKTINLNVYGDRVRYFHDTIIITAGAAVRRNTIPQPPDEEDSHCEPIIEQSPTGSFVVEQPRLVTPENNGSKKLFIPTLEECIDEIVHDPARPVKSKSSRAIAAELKARGTYSVSYGTINRRINAIKGAANAA